MKVMILAATTAMIVPAGALAEPWQPAPVSAPRGGHILRNCMAEQVRRAEASPCTLIADNAAIDPRFSAGIRVPARSYVPVHHYFQANDYPAGALRQRLTGAAIVRITIDATGLVQDCVTTTTSGSTILDDATCAVLRQRARYHPAVDLGGKRVRSTLDQKVSWRLP